MAPGPQGWIPGESKDGPPVHAENNWLKKQNAELEALVTKLEARLEDVDNPVQVIERVREANDRLRTRVADLVGVYRAACDHLVYNGPCDNEFEEDDDTHCVDEDCTYCVLNAVASAVKEGE